jgi:hypothetical protein
MYMTVLLTCVTPPSWPCKTYKGSILLSTYTAVVWLYEPTASIPLCGEKEIEDIIPVMRTKCSEALMILLGCVCLGPSPYLCICTCVCNRENEILEFSFQSTWYTESGWRRTAMAASPSEGAAARGGSEGGA